MIGRLGVCASPLPSIHFNRHKYAQWPFVVLAIFSHMAKIIRDQPINRYYHKAVPCLVCVGRVIKNRNHLNSSTWNIPLVCDHCWRSKLNCSVSEEAEVAREIEWKFSAVQPCSWTMKWVAKRKNLIKRHNEIEIILFHCQGWEETQRYFVLLRKTWDIPQHRSTLDIYTVFRFLLWTLEYK